MLRTITFIRQHWHGLVMASVLVSLALLTPQVNAADAPPSAVFASWPDDRPAPQLQLTARQYANEGWYLELHAEGFAFSEVCQAVTGPQTIGHAHIYVGERKVAAAYVPRVSLGHLRPGRHIFRAVLRAQDHRALIGPDGLIASTIVIAVPEDRSP
jgi:hypothetical protein